MMCQSVSVTTTNKLYSIEFKCLGAFNVYIYSSDDNDGKNKEG